MIDDKPSYRDRVRLIYRQQGISTQHHDAIDAALRLMLRELGVRPEHIEIAFEHVMAGVFAKHTH
jgi:hypothetical protein